MKFINLLLIYILLFYGCTADNNSKTIIILIEQRLSEKINNEIEQYISDIKNEGYEAIMIDSVNSEMSPEFIKDILVNEISNHSSITGAVFIGNIQAPLFNEQKYQGDAYWHDYLCDYFYMDIDGIWVDSDNNGVYDKHLDTEYSLLNKIKRKLGIKDNRLPEIWVSRIRADKLTGLGDEIELLKSYFKKNHDYRSGKLKLPAKRAFVVAAGVDFSKSEWGAFPELIYSDITNCVFNLNLADTLRSLLKSDEGYEWGVVNVFSGPRIHHFNHFNDEINSELWKTKEGRRAIAEYSDRINNQYDVSSQEIYEIQPNVLFYHLLTSETGRHDFTDNLSGSYIFSGKGLVAIAGTQHSGSIGTKLFYEDIKHNKTFGAAWKNSLSWLTLHENDVITIYYFPNSHQNIYAGKSIRKAVLIGDGTLKIPSNYGNNY